MKIRGKAFWLFMFTVVSMTILLLPQTIWAQEQTDLTLYLVTNTYYNEVSAGKDNTFLFKIVNTGNTPITNIRLSLDQPEDWVIYFNPETIGYLSPGDFQTVDVNIKPPKNLDREQYNITLIATTNEIQRVVDVWVTIKPASHWLWVGISIGVVIVAVFVFIYLRFGRQKL